MPTKEFGPASGWQRWDVPKKVEWVEVVATGAGSGDIPGGRVTGRINVKGMNSLRMLVGEKGTAGGGPTQGGGAAGGKGRGLADGWSGGGGTVIRANSKTGAIKAVAGGAGGSSGDGGPGGFGGGDVGEAGSPAAGTTGAVGNATGGTQIQGGNGGASVVSALLAGHDADDTVLSPGGAGGAAVLPRTTGGGGGGGGYRGGGGGQAGLEGQTAGGGGGGGSSFIAGLTGYTNTQGGGGTGNGRVTLTWVTPKPANQPANAPTDVKVGGEDYSDEMPTLSKGQVTIKARVNDPDTKNVRLVVQYSPNDDFSQARTEVSEPVAKGKIATVKLTGLSQNTLYRARLYARDSAGLLSINYTSLRFWTNRSPDAPAQQTPSENATISDLDSVLFTWNHIDPDHPEVAHQGGFELQYRRAASPLVRGGEWVTVGYDVEDETYVGEPGVFKAGSAYEWRVRTKDRQNAWGPWSPVRSFYVVGVSAPPIPLSPARDEAVTNAEPLALSWLFRSFDGAPQALADVRFRQIGADTWVTLFGGLTIPGDNPEWVLAAGELFPGHYEWQVRTRAGDGEPSDWSDSERFWMVRTPAITTAPVVPVTQVPATLGTGHNEFHVFRRGGEHYLGELKPLADTAEWSRTRDDISYSRLVTNGSRTEASLLREIECWAHEVVVFRNGERVAEGPITLAQDTPQGFRIEAKCVMGYVYRRILRQGYNDAYRIVNNVQLGSRSAVQRARQIIMNALAYDDPNILEYLTTFDFPDDAQESRVVPDYSKTAWEEVDSLAATGGIDYTCLGRRIIINDTHRAIGRLPEMRSEHFSDPVVVSQYGMLLATDYAVTNNDGVWGIATRREQGEAGPYGVVEMLSSQYGESEGGGTTEAMTSLAQAELELVLADQATRSIASRWPTPRVVRVPDNATLLPSVPLKINHLVPGVWIPLRATGTVREIAQWQKLDLLRVQETKDGEKIMVTMSPAPNRGEDPDADSGSEVAE